MTEFEEAKEWLAKQAYEARNKPGLGWDAIHCLKKESMGNTAFATLKAIHSEEYAKAALISAYRDWKRANPNELDKAKEWLREQVFTLMENLDADDPARKDEWPLDSSELNSSDLWFALVKILGKENAEERLLATYRDEVKHE